MIITPCDYFLFLRLKIPMKETRYDDMSTIQAAVTRAFKANSKADFQKSVDPLIDRVQYCIDTEGTYFE
ncbi:hypothetical protein WH47_08086 [Habropoda laboriosa]|uniref:Uncharacterized protein n=1 Tax=Habropoda laboriosa TaxID=597456 RepID=A0A0L7RI07_9HYME|nr:hypothetical protein WH47_08086 [Habropoda laboriosa]